MGLLGHDEILKLYDAAVAARLVDRRSALLEGIDPHFVATLPKSGSGAEELLQALQHMDDAGALADGSVPLVVWLDHAVRLCGGRKEAAVFQATLDRLKPREARPKADEPAGKATEGARARDRGAQREDGARAPLPGWITPAGFVLGVAGLIGVVVLAIEIPEPSRFQYDIFRTLAALTGGAFSMALTGLLAVRLNFPGGGYIAGGGTLGVFVALYFFSPAVLPAPAPLPPQPSATATAGPSASSVAPPPTVIPIVTVVVPAPTNPHKPQPKGSASAIAGKEGGIAPGAGARCAPGSIEMEFRKQDSARCGGAPAGAYMDQGKLRWVLEVENNSGEKTPRSCFCTPAAQ
jgi:Effector-associated domain 5